MTITVTDYLDVISSWCFWSEPMWAELKRRYDGRIQFQWKIALMDPNGFAGVNGIFRFKSDGTSERGLAVLEVTSTGPLVVSPAPTTFLGKNS